MGSLKWQTYEYVYKKKSADWFWAVGIIAVSVAVTSILFNNFLFGILILIAAGALMMYASREPLLLDIEIGMKGVRAGKDFYPYVNLESFWVASEDEWPRVILKTKATLSPLVVIGIEDMDADVIQEYLKSHLEEKEITEPLLEVLMEKLGF